MSAICGARTKKCRQCGHKYTKSEYNLWECPECGEPRACKQPVAVEGIRCKFHGGASLSGVAHPRFKTGRYSKYLPGDLVARFEKCASDPELLSLRDEIALIDIRLGELAKVVLDSGGPSYFDDIVRIYEEMKTARDKKDSAAFFGAITEFGEVVHKGGSIREAWAEITDLQDHRRKLAEAERKRIIDAQQMITIEQAMVLLARIQAVIIQNVTDTDVLAAIAAEFRRIAVAQPR